VVSGEVALGHAHTRFDDDGRLNDPNLDEQVHGVVQNLVAVTRERVEEQLAA
jgi:hypothetical protein